jgi:hypothetical protein
MSNDRSLFSRAPKAHWRAAIAIAGWLAIGCTGAPVATPSVPGATASGSPAASESPSTSPGLSASPSLSPSVGPTAASPSTSPSSSPTAQAPSASPLGPFDIEWQRQAADFGARVQLVDSAVVDDRIVVIGSRFDDNVGGYAPAIWWEDGDLVWRLADVPTTTGQDPWLSAIISGGPGLVVVGSGFDEDFALRGLVWLSTDGKTWQSGHGSGLDDKVWNATSNGQGATLGLALDGLVLVGRDGEADGVPVILVSADGSDWHLAGSATQQMALGIEALAGSGAQLTAFERRVDADACGDMTGGICTVGPVRVWRASGADDWQMVGELPDSDDGSLVAGVGPRGWATVGGDGAYISADGIDWQRGGSFEPVTDSLFEIFGVTAGFVGVGSSQPAEHCTADECFSLTWTSPDGRSWQLVDEMEGSSISSLRRRGSALIAIGIDSAETGAVWTAQLP